MTSDLLDDLIRSVLNDPLPDEQPPDWESVLQRRLQVSRPPVDTTSSGRGQRTRRRRVRRLLIAALVVAVLFVPPAVAFHRQLFDLIQGDPAPESVQHTFRAWNVLVATARERPSGEGLAWFSRLSAGEAQGVVEFRTAHGGVTVWEAPQRDGGKCWIFVFEPTTATGSSATAPLTGSCDQESPATETIDRVQWLKADALPDVLIVHARVHREARVELRFADGSTEPMTLAAGHALAAIAADSAPVALIASDSEGSVMQIAPLHFPSRGMPPACPAVCSGGGSEREQFTVVGARPVTQPPDRLVTVASGQWHGKPWTFKASDPVRVEGPYGGLIRFRHSMSYAGERSTVGSASFFMRNSRLRSYAISGPSGINCPGLEWITGAVVASARTVDVRLSTGATTRLRTIAPPPGPWKNFRFYVSTPKPCGARRGPQPVSMVARDAAGRIVARWTHPLVVAGVPVPR
jgi:hypothetical protein